MYVHSKYTTVGNYFPRLLIECGWSSGNTEYGLYTVYSGWSLSYVLLWSACNTYITERARLPIRLGPVSWTAVWLSFTLRPWVSDPRMCEGAWLPNHPPNLTLNSTLQEMSCSEARLLPLFCSNSLILKDVHFNQVNFFQVKWRGGCHHGGTRTSHIFALSGSQSMRPGIRSEVEPWLSHHPRAYPYPRVRTPLTGVIL